jgi:TPP-dependent pyruvate/acetoin dehydrogenase alpha subunit
VTSQALEKLAAADALRCAACPAEAPLGGHAPAVAGVLAALRAEDWWCPGPRERVGAVLRGVEVAEVLDPLVGAAAVRIAPTTASTRPLLAVGIALATPEAAVAVHLGMAHLGDGSLHEALNLAALQRARVRFLVHVRSLSGAPVPPQAAASAMDLAAAHGVAARELDGLDAAAVAEAVREVADVHAPVLFVVRT